LSSFQRRELRAAFILLGQVNREKERRKEKDIESTFRPSDPKPLLKELGLSAFHLTVLSFRAFLLCSVVAFKVAR